MTGLPVLVVLYNPDSDVRARASELARLCSLYVYDNSTGESDFGSSPVSARFHDGVNRGISAALIWMYHECVQRGIEHFLFLDQDTIITEDAVQSIAKQIQQDTGRSALINFSSQRKATAHARFVINSGTVFDVSLLGALSSIVPRYFVDAVDLAVCLWGRSMGASVEVRPVAGIDHISGQGIRAWRLLGRRWTGKHYSTPRRREFIVAHLRLLYDCVRLRAWADALEVFKFTVSFIFEQVKCDILERLGAAA